MNKKLAISSITILIFVFIFHYLGLNDLLYIKIPKLDIYIHLFAGIGIGLAVLFVWESYFHSFPRHLFITLLSLTLLGGILWELFEAYYDIAGWPLWTDKYYFDTAKDLFMDTIGAIVTWLIIKFKKLNQ